VLPHALFVAGLTLGRGEFIEVAARTTEFLLGITLHGDHFSFIGTRGWYERGKSRAAFDRAAGRGRGHGDERFAPRTTPRRKTRLLPSHIASTGFWGANDLGLTLSTSAPGLLRMG
jgi:hypothetical protein